MFKGSGVALVTPMNEDGSINESKFYELIDYHINNSTDAIIVAGTTGECSTLSEEEHMELIKMAVTYSNKRILIIAGTGSNDSLTAINLSLKAMEYGVDGLLVINPYYNKCNRSGMINYFTSIADAVDIPIIMYNVPGRTGQAINVDVVLELALHPNIIGIKEASGDLDYLMELCTSVPKDFYVYSGNDDQLIPLLALGGVGVISVAANIIPNEMHDLVMAYLNNETSKALELQTKYFKLIKDLFIEVNPVPIKEAMNYLGYECGPTRFPLGTMDNDNLVKLRATITAYQLGTLK